MDFLLTFLSSQETTSDISEMRTEHPVAISHKGARRLWEKIGKALTIWSPRDFHCSFYSIQVRTILKVYGKREETHKRTQMFSTSGPKP